MNKKIIIAGAVTGILMPVIGVFLGLQVSVILGNIFAFPLIAISYLNGIPFGKWGLFWWVLAFITSAFLWTLILSIISAIFKKRR